MGTVDVAEADGDKPVCVAVGDEVRIALAQPGGTGFVWSAASLPPHLTLQSNVMNHSAAMPGAAAQRVITLAAVQAGRGTVELTLSRPWPGGETDRRVVFDVTVE